MVKQIAQSVTDLSYRQAPTSRTLRRVARLARRCLTGATDVSVRYEVGGTDLELPFAHDLPYYRATYPSYGDNLGIVAKYLAHKYGSNLRIIDVGANIGDTAAIIRAQCGAPILCVEGDTLYLRYLRANAASIGGVRIEPAFLAASDGFVHGHSVSGQGTASLEPSASLTSVRSVESVLEDHPKFSQAQLIKLDTDGYDLTILAGAHSWLLEVQPVIFLEFDPFLARRAVGHFDTAILTTMQRLGYSRLAIWSNEGDFVAGLPIDGHEETLLQLLAFFSGDVRRRYCDIALFTDVDEDVFRAVRHEALGHSAPPDLRIDAQLTP